VGADAAYIAGRIQAEAETADVAVPAGIA